MNYTASISDFFKSPKWLTNLGLGALCTLIPILGPIVIMGWLVIGFWGREGQRFEDFPVFDFNLFGKYLERGIWPFLVVFVATMAMMSCIFILVFPLGLVAGLLAGSNGDNGGPAGVILTIGIVIIYFAVLIAMILVTIPLKVRASMTQDFAKSFSFSFVKRFIALTWKETILGWLFLTLAGFAFVLAGMLAFCVGIYFVMTPIYFAWTHLSKQLYALYLSRGGEPVERSPKLDVAPPPLPAT